MLRKVLNLSIAARMISLLVLTVVLFAGVILLWFLPMVEEETFSDRKKGLKDIVDVSYALLSEYEQRAGLEEFSREEAQERAMTRIRQMRYGDNDYLWVNDDTLPFPRMIMHPTKPELDGRILDDPLFECAASMEFGKNGMVQDIPGRDKNLFQAFVEVVAQTGDGFVVYDWPRPTRDGVTQERYLKHSYVRQFQPWGWIIGTGVYVDDIAAQTARMRMTVISVTSVVLAAVMLVALFFIASIQRPMKALRSYAEKVTQGDLDFETSGRFYGETDQLKQAITTMVGRLKQTIRDTEIKSLEAEHAAGELQKSNKRYDQLARQSRTMIWEVDADGLYTHVGAVAVELIGYHPRELVDRVHFYDLHPREGREAFKTAVMEKFQQRVSFVDLDNPLMHKDGHTVWVSTNGFPELNSDGALSGYRGSDIDITERKQAEEELRVSEARFKSIIAVSNTGAWEYHRDRDYLWCSPEYFTMLGYDPDEFTMDGSANLSQVWIDLIHHDDRKKAAGHFSEYLAGGSVGMYENHFRMKSRDGGWVWIWSRGQTLRDSRGNLTDRTVGTHIDITERKQAEEALLESEEMQRKILQTVPDVIIRTDLEGMITFVNELAFPGLRNHPEASICGKNIFSFVAEHDRPRAVENARARLEKDIGPQEYQLRFDDSVIDTEVNGAVIRDREARAMGMVYVIRDISERKQTEMELQEKNILLEGILDNIPDLVSVKRPDLSIIRYNRSGYNFLGTSLEQARGRKCYDLMGRTSPCQPCASLDAMRRKQLTRHENYYPKLGVHLHCQANPVIGADGRIEYVVELLRDITPRKLAEQEREKLHSHLMQAQKMESVGILAGGVAHDFNNLLHAMRGNIEMLLQGKSADCSETRRLERVTRSMDRAAQLVKQLLLFSRKAEPKKDYVNLNHEMQEVARILERTIPKMIAVELHFDPSIWALFIDPVQIEQVLLNLASNAVDAMPDGGRLTIETANVEVDEGFVRAHPGSNSGRHVLMTVSDTGCGMDREIMDHVFDPFFTTKEVGKGTGLGLASVYGIVKAHGGYIQCYSEPGLGSTFRVYLPAVEQGDVKQIEQMPEPLLRDGSETILVVDDEGEIRELTHDALEMLGYSVKMAVNGEQALDIYREHGQSIDLVLLDLNMPGMGGYKCLKELLRLDPEVKVVIASGYAANNHGRGAVSSGARGFIGKPYQLQELDAKVREVLDG